MGGNPGSREPSPDGLGPSGFDPGRIDEVIAKLSPLERDLIAGRCNAWGSWMWSAGSYMVSLGLGTKTPGNIQFDTPLAAAVIAKLNEEQINERPS